MMNDPLVALQVLVLYFTDTVCAPVVEPHVIHFRTSAFACSGPAHDDVLRVSQLGPFLHCHTL
jgi:hypothetical protein